MHALVDVLAIVASSDRESASEVCTPEKVSSARRYLTTLLTSIHQYLIDIFQQRLSYKLSNTHSFFYPMLLASMLRNEETACILKKHPIYSFITGIFSSSMASSNGHVSKGADGEDVFYMEDTQKIFCKLFLSSLDFTKQRGYECSRSMLELALEWPDLELQCYAMGLLKVLARFPHKLGTDLRMWMLTIVLQLIGGL